MIEGDQLGDVQQIRFRKQRVGPEPLRQTLAPRGSRPPEVADEAAAERRQRRVTIAGNRLQSGSQRFEWLLRKVGSQRARDRAATADGQPRRCLPGHAAAVARRATHSDVAVATQRAFEEERIATFGLLLIEKTEDAERRQQITGQLDGSRAAPKAGSGAGSSWARL